MTEREEIEVILGGEDVCYAHVLCEECGAVLDGSHDQPCPVRAANNVSTS